jgi:hypothetical protein
MKIWYKVTEIPEDVLLEWLLAFEPDQLQLLETDFKIQAIYQRQRISLCTAANPGDAFRDHLELFYLNSKL